jgi:hypothetical protein
MKSTSLVVGTIAHIFLEEAIKGKNPFDATKGIGTPVELKRGREVGRYILKAHLKAKGVTEDDIKATLERYGI